MLDLIKEYFGCGYIRRDYSDKTVKFEIRDRDQLIDKVIPHFEKFPLISRKQKDFDLFATIVRRIHMGEHLTKRGLIDLVTLAYQMNGSGKRRRTKEEIIDDLNSH